MHLAAPTMLRWVAATAVAAAAASADPPDGSTLDATLPAALHRAHLIRDAAAEDGGTAASPAALAGTAHGRAALVEPGAGLKDVRAVIPPSPLLQQERQLRGGERRAHLDDPQPAPNPSPMPPPNLTTGPTFLSCAEFNLDDNEEACEAAYGGNVCQWIGNCHNCGCVLLPQDNPYTPPPLTINPSTSLSESPTFSPSGAPSKSPTESSSTIPSSSPTGSPTYKPTDHPTYQPTEAPTNEPTDNPTNQPTKAPTNEPTNPPTNHPTEFPTDEPTASPTNKATEDAKYHAVCGRGSGCREADLESHMHDIHEVRCCSDVQRNDWKKRTSCDVWAQSIIDGGCNKAPFLEAKALCENTGARLCSKAELKEGCTRGSGCGFDKHLIWSGSLVSGTNHYVVCGKGAGCRGGNSFVDSDDTLHEVRCCSDFQLPQWSKRSDCSVWAESIIDGQCFYNKSYGEAHQICSDAGGRLCTKSELEGKCSKGTGCSFDAAMIWSGTEE